MAVSDIFSTEGFPARWNCGVGWEENPTWGYVHILSDLLVWGAYTAIPVVLAYFIYRRKDIPLPGIFWLFCVFIFACGTTHLIEATIFYWPVYRLSGVMKLITAAASWATVAALIPATPKALRLPGLAKVNEELSREVEIRQQTERELARANRVLEAKNQDMSEYLSIITHDLKHPAFSIQTLQTLLKKKASPALDEQDRRFIDLSIGECERMMEMLGQLSSLARIEGTEVRIEAVPLRQFLSRCVERFTGRAERSQCVMTFDAPDAAVKFARQQVEESLNNILDNALKYGCKGHDDGIAIAARIDGHRCTISVQDRGPGIDPRHHARIFQLFHRVDRDAAKGTGVGLASVKKLMQRIGGDVTVDSTPGDGTRFTLAFDLH